MSIKCKLLGHQYYSWQNVDLIGRAKVYWPECQRKGCGFVYEDLGR